MKKYLVVRGKYHASPTPHGNYSIYGLFKSDKEGIELETEMKNYAIDQMVNNDKVPRECCLDFYTFYKDLSFPGVPSLVNSIEFIVERSVGNLFYGFIKQEDIQAIFDL